MPLVHDLRDAMEDVVNELDSLATFVEVHQIPMPEATQGVIEAALITSKQIKAGIVAIRSVLEMQRRLGDEARRSDNLQS